MVIYFLFVALSGIEFVALLAGLFLFLRYKSQTTTKLLASQAQVREFEDRFKTNPSYDCQMVLADMLSGNGLFRIERIERENLFYHRR
jgi:hypothetical protein